jgi:phosphate transport system substrate-binding protein
MVCAGAVALGVFGAPMAASASATTIKEAGSSLVFPLVSRWSHVYTADTVAAAAGGSGAGISSISSNGVDIGASDAPMSASQYAGDQAHNPVEIPWALSATEVVYNIPGVHAGLKLNATIMAEIYTGKITSWGSKAIVKLNPRFKKALKRAPKITPVFRSDGSGDSFVFQNFMYKGARKAWMINGQRIPPSTAFPGTVGQGENGNYGVAGEVSNNAGAVGYVSAYYVISQHGVHPAALENAAGRYVMATGASIIAASKSDSTIPAQGSAFTSDDGVPIQYPSKKYKTAFPAATYTYAIVNKDGSHVSAVQSFLDWAITTGQKYGAALQFYTLPSSIVNQDKSLISGL